MTSSKRRKQENQKVTQKQWNDPNLLCGVSPMVEQFPKCIPNRVKSETNGQMRGKGKNC